MKKIHQNQRNPIEFNRRLESTRFFLYQKQSFVRWNHVFCMRGVHVVSQNLAKCTFLRVRERQLIKRNAKHLIGDPENIRFLRCKWSRNRQWDRQMYRWTYGHIGHLIIGWVCVAVFSECSSRPAKKPKRANTHRRTNPKKRWNMKAQAHSATTFDGIKSSGLTARLRLGKSKGWSYCGSHWRG